MASVQADDEKAMRQSSGLPSVHATVNYDDTDAVVELFDGRGDVSRFTLDTCGFSLIQGWPTALSPEEFYDERAVVLRFYPEVTTMLRTVMGASLVLPVSHQVRNAGRKREEAAMPNGPQTPLLVRPAYVVHNDHYAHSGYSFALRRLGASEGESRVGEATNARFAVVNVWRPLSLVQRDALAFIDARTLAPDEHYGPDGHWYMPAHRWYFFSSMTPDEVLLFKQFDNGPDTAPCAVHTSFHDPVTPEDAPPRESIDVRCLVFFSEALPSGFGDAFLAERRLSVSLRHVHYEYPSNAGSTGDAGPEAAFGRAEDAAAAASENDDCGDEAVGALAGIVCGSAGGDAALVAPPDDLVA